jgi:hypothetical protein
MNLYLLQRKDFVDYDEYDSCVVVAATAEDAKYICPSEYSVWNKELQKYGFEMHDGTIEYRDRTYHGWDEPDNLLVVLIGKANDTFKEGDIICASFNAG